MTNEKQPAWLKYMMLALAWIAVFTAAYAQFQLPVLATRIIPEMGITPAQFASMITAPMIPSVLLSVIAGLLCDRFGIKRIVSIALIIGTVGVTARYFANSYVSMMFFLVLAGMGNVFVNVNLVKIIGAWFEPEQISKIMGIALTSATAGMAVGLGTTAFFADVNTAYLFGGVLCIISTVLWMMFLKERPEGAVSHHAQGQHSVGELLRVPMQSSALWIAGGCLLLMMGCFMTINSFLPLVLTEVKGMSPVAAGGVSSVVVFGNLIGSIVSPVIAYKFGLYRPYILMAAIIGALSIYFGWNADGGILMLSMFIVGFCLGGVLPLYMSLPMILKEIGPKYAGGAAGLLATLMLLGAVVIPSHLIAPIAGSDYSLLFALAAGCLVLMGLLTMLLPEFGPKAKQ